MVKKFHAIQLFCLTLFLVALLGGVQRVSAQTVYGELFDNNITRYELLVIAQEIHEKLRNNEINHDAALAARRIAKHLRVNYAPSDKQGIQQQLIRLQTVLNYSEKSDLDEKSQEEHEQIAACWQHWHLLTKSLEKIEYEMNLLQNVYANASHTDQKLTHDVVQKKLLELDKEKTACLKQLMDLDHFLIVDNRHVLKKLVTYKTVATAVGAIVCLVAITALTGDNKNWATISNKLGSFFGFQEEVSAR